MTLTLDPDVLQRWVGRTESREDIMLPGPARAMQALLDSPASLVVGDPLPPLWHWLYFHTLTRQSELGPDGHAALGGFLPPVALPRRMWAGGRLTFHAPLLIGGPANKSSEIKSVEVKSGRSGALCFVTVQHDLTQGDQLCLTEEHDIVYRDMVKPGEASEPPAPPQNAESTRTIAPSTTLLFRYSALTFNGHRIHYDVDYCRDVEGYPGLVFHGPLTATLLAQLATDITGAPLKTFSFRAVSPLFHTAPFGIAGRRVDDRAEIWATTPDGGLAMRADATT